MRMLITAYGIVAFIMANCDRAIELLLVSAKTAFARPRSYAGGQCAVEQGRRSSQRIFEPTEAPTTGAL